MVKSHRIEQDKFRARRAALIEFYEEFNPDKIDTVDDTLREHAGRSVPEFLRGLVSEPS